MRPRFRKSFRRSFEREVCKQILICFITDRMNTTNIADISTSAMSCTKHKQMSREEPSCSSVVDSVAHIVRSKKLGSHSQLDVYPFAHVLYKFIVLGATALVLALPLSRCEFNSLDMDVCVCVCVDISYSAKNRLHLCDFMRVRCTRHKF